MNDEKALTDGHELHLNDEGFASFDEHNANRIWYHREWVFKHGNDRGETALHRAVLGNLLFPLRICPQML